MRKLMTILAISSPFLLAGCQGPEVTANPVPKPPAVASMSPEAGMPQRVSGAAPPGPRQVSRTIEDDPDGDGIADYRVVITDTFDARGSLVSTSRQQDFEADGIFDARNTTYFDD